MAVLSALLVFVCGFVVALVLLVVFLVVTVGHGTPRPLRPPFPPGLVAADVLPAFRYAVVEPVPPLEPPVTPLYTLQPDVPGTKPQWLNVFLRRLFRELATDPVFMARIAFSISRAIDKKTLSGGRLSFLGPLRLARLELGSEPVCEHARVVATENGGELWGELDVHKADGLRATLHTELYVNVPTPRAFCLPISLTVHVKRLAARLFLYFPPQTGERFHLGFTAPPHEFDAEVLGHIGEPPLEFTALPGVHALLCAVVRTALSTLLTYPRSLGLYVPLPGFKHDAEPRRLLGKVPRPHKRAKLGRVWAVASQPREIRAKLLVYGRFVAEVLNAHRYATLAELFTDDVCVNWPTPGASESIRQGRGALHAVLVELHTAFPDLQFAIDDVHATKAQWIWCRWFAKGHQYGPLWHRDATGDETLLRGLFFGRFNDDGNLVCEQHVWFDAATCFRLARPQLTAATTMG